MLFGIVNINKECAYTDLASIVFGLPVGITPAVFYRGGLVIMRSTEL
jgi:hypothetical protein